MTTTCLRNTDWLIGWDATAERHVYRRGCDLVFNNEQIEFVGKHFDGEVDVDIDASDRFVVPGLIDIHSHPSTEPAQKGVREEHAVPAMHMSSLYQRTAVFSLDQAGRAAAVEVAYADLLSSGVTTLVDLSFPFEGWTEVAAKSGLRLYMGPGFSSATWKLESEHELLFDWHSDDGADGFQKALSLINEVEDHPSDRLRGILYPAQIDTCSKALFEAVMTAAQSRDLPVTTHISQSVAEFDVMVRRHGKTPIQWAAEIGILEPRMTLGHALFIDEHSWLSWPSKTDLGLLADSGTSVAHCPQPFARYGQVLEDFGRYQRAGVNLGVGTDCAPHNLIEEMRVATVLSHVGARDMTTASAADLFYAATIGGAKALLREDIGRLAPGCKADIVSIDLNCDSMQPVRDPLRSLVYHAADRAVRDVFVGGEKVVDNHEVKSLDRRAALKTLSQAQTRMLEQTAKLDYQARTSEQISPLSFPIVD
jgi:5-methylthioadenosine/S-adenosylhomocysteine deaminase